LAQRLPWRWLGSAANEIRNRPRKAAGVQSPLAAYQELRQKNPPHHSLKPGALHFFGLASADK
jgi:hypothetical protein